jgi:hypothetical protein
MGVLGERKKGVSLEGQTNYIQNRSKWKSFVERNLTDLNYGWKTDLLVIIGITSAE